MNPLRFTLFSISLMAMLCACGEPCKQLEEKICDDLGEQDCIVWKRNDRPGFPGVGRKPTRSCVNALGNYDLHMKGIRAGIEALKEAQQTVDKAKAKQAASKQADDTKADDDKQTADETSKPKPAASDSQECAALVAKLCGELGEARCNKWKEAGKPGLKANALQCKMAMKKETFYQRHLKLVKAATP